MTYWADPIELEFLGGFLLAAGVKRLPRVPAWVPLSVALVALVVALSYPGSPPEFLIRRAFVWGIPGLLVLWAAVALESHFELRQRRWLLLGDASYSLYLTQGFALPPVVMALKRLHLHGVAGLAIFYVTGAVVCLAAGIAVHLWIELPMLERLSRRPPPWSVRSAESV